MNSAETTSNTKTTSTVKTHASKFAKVLNGRKQPIRGLWKRGERYYAQLAIENPVTGVKKMKRVPLKNKDGNPVTTDAEAVMEMGRVKVKRDENNLPVLTRQPKLSAYVTDYFLAIGESKKPGTIEKEKTILARWTEKYGDMRIDQIKRVHVNRFIESRLEQKISPRTINLDIIGLRVVLKKALSEQLIQRLPTEGLRPLKTSTSKRSLFTAAELEKLCGAAFETKEDKAGKTVPLTENAQQFVDYVRLMAYCGSRRNETFGIKWEDVDFDNGQLFIRRQVTERGIETLKNSEQRSVDFNPKLRALLNDMKQRRAPDLEWLFPSPQRGNKDIPAKSFRESLELVRERAKLPNFGFHDCRHHFISMAVMAGIDYMTIAAWVGHRDGGVLIGKVYGHIANEHRKEMAERLNFAPVIVEQAVSA